MNGVHLQERAGASEVSLNEGRLGRGLYVLFDTLVRGLAVLVGLVRPVKGKDQLHACAFAEA